MDEELAPRPAEAHDRVGIIGTDPLRVLGLKTIFGESSRFELTQLSIPGALEEHDLSLVLIDSDSTTHLFELIAAFRKARPQLKLMVLGPDTSQEQIERVIGAGAKGYLPVTASEKEVRLAIESVRDGSVWAPRKVLSRLLDGQKTAKPPQFTARERQILQLLRAGRSNREISAVLQIDESTVKAHMGRLMRKVGVTNRIALTIHPSIQND